MTTQPKGEQAKQPQTLLDFILLQLLDTEPMRAQQLTSAIRQTFGLTFDSETLNLILYALKNRGYVDTKHSINLSAATEPYKLTSEGRNMLTYAENLLIATCRQLDE